MVVSYENDGDTRYAFPVDAAIREAGYRVMVGLEDQPHTTVQIQGELPLSVTGQWMRPPGHQLAHMGCRLQVRQPAAELASTCRTQFPDGKALLLAQRAEVVIGYVEFQPSNSIAFTILVNDIIASNGG